MYFESFRVGIVTLRVSQAKKIPNNSRNPWYEKTTEKKKTKKTKQKKKTRLIYVQGTHVFSLLGHLESFPREYTTL